MSKQQDLQPVGEYTDKSKRAMAQKALEYTVQIKQRNARSLEHKLWRITRSIEALDPKSSNSNVLRELVTATEEFDLIQFDLKALKGHGVRPRISGCSSFVSLVSEVLYLQCYQHE